MLSKQKEQYLKKIYYNIKSPVSFSGINKLYQYVKINSKLDFTKTDIKRWLAEQDTYTINRPVKEKFKRPRVLGFHKNYMWHVDTAYLNKWPMENNGYKYFVLFTDILSHYAYAVPLKTLTADEMVSAMQKVFSQAKPQYLFSDLGVEYRNLKVEKLLKDLKIKQIFTNGSVKKAILAERLIKTIKSKIFKILFDKQNNNWLSILPDVIASYNSAVHSSIKVSPNKALTLSDSKLFEAQYERDFDKEPDKVERYRFNINDKVRISRLRNPFSREYDQTFTEEFFLITNRFRKSNIVYYTLKDLGNSNIQGLFQNNELTLVHEEEGKKYKIETVLGKKKIRNVPHLLVKWVGWGKKFNSYIPETELENYKSS